MELWNIWMALVNQFKPACTRQRTFFWLVTILIGFSIKFDAVGATSLARGVGLLPGYYTCMLNFFNSTAVNIEALQTLWIRVVFNQFTGLVRINGRCLIAEDGIKIGKEGKKMPGVKWLHQESESNSKAEYIMGHSIQAVSILAKGLSTFEYCVVELFWKPLGSLAKFVLVRHPEKGNAIPMSTDLALDPMDIIFAYTLRFKIEVMFKQAVHQVGAFMYRFWLKAMLPRKRGSGDCVLQFEPVDFKEKILSKLNAYHLFIQLGFYAHGLMQYLSIHHHPIVWRNFGTCLRTIRDNTLPSEKVVALALGRGYIEFLIDDTIAVIFKKFLRRRTDISQLQQCNFEQKQAA